MTDIHDKMLDIMYNLFNNNDLITSLRSNSSKSDLLLCIDLVDNESTSINVNLFKKLKKSEFIKRELPKYKKVTSSDTTNNCCICLETYSENTYKRTLNCSHHFHKKCIDKWFRNCDDDDISCPMCRSKYELKLDKIDSFVLETTS